MPSMKDRTAAIPLLAALTEPELPEPARVGELMNELLGGADGGPPEAISLTLILTTNCADMLRSAVQTSGDEQFHLNGYLKSEGGGTEEPNALDSFSMHMIEHQCNNEWEELVDHLLQLSNDSRMFQAFLGSLILMYRRIALSIGGDVPFAAFHVNPTTTEVTFEGTGD